MKRRRKIKRDAPSSGITGVFFGITFCWVVGVPFSWFYLGLLVGATTIGMVLSYYPLIWLSRWLDKRADAEDEIVRQLEQDRDGLQLPDEVKEEVWEKLQKVLKPHEPR